jgi:hypothetical protein
METTLLSSNRELMGSDNLILKGNQLMVAARDGKIGLVVEEILSLQKAFLLQEKTTTTGVKIQQVVGGLGLIGGLMMIVGITFGGGDIVALLGSVVSLAFGVVMLAGPIGTKRRAAEYVTLVEREHHKIPKPTEQQ